MRVTLNGKSIDLDGVRTIGELIEHRKLKPSLVAVEQNGEIVPRDQFETREVQDGDQIEIVHFVGGG